MDLKDRFLSTFENWILSEQKRSDYWIYLETQYSEPFRAYHNLAHLEELFRYYDEFKSELKHPIEVAFAIFYHDCIYDIWSKKNEKLSAEKAISHLENEKIPKQCLDRIYNLILVTKDHTSTSNPDELWMIDFDLAILGQPWDTYENYTTLIRREYKKVPSILYRKGRKKVLKHFLEKAHIFQTETFQNRFEAQARHNLTHELNLL